MLSIAALIPLALILVLMLWRRWGAAQAGAAGYLTALVIAAAVLKASPILLAYAHMRALLLALDVLLIIWAAFLFYRVTDEAGVIRTIGQSLPFLTSDAGLQVLIVSFAFASFMQGVGGFGVNVAVTAPLMASLGFNPVLSVVLPSIGSCWSATFGSLGSAFQALISSTGLSGAELAPATAFNAGAAALGAGLMVCLAYGGLKGLARLAAPALLIGGVMAAVQYVTAASGLWNLAILAGGAAGMLVCLPLGRLWRNSPAGGAIPPRGKLPLNQLLLALCGYALLTLVTLIFQLSPVVKQAFGFLTLQVAFPEVQTGLGYVTPAGLGRVISFLTHPGASLLYSSILAFLLFRLSGCYRPGAAGRILGGTYKQLLPSSVGIMAMVSMAVIMENAGMTDALARSLALGVGSLFPFTSAWIGALGSFMSGSNTNSNVVFGALQLKTAGMLKLDLPIILAAQSIGGSIGSAAAPAKVIVGASTGSLAGQEGLVLRKLIGYILAVILLISLVTAGRILLGGS